MKRHVLTGSLLALSVALTACNDSDDDGNYESKPAIPVNNIANPVVATPVAYTETDLTAVADESVVMTYKMLGINNNETQATALVFTPKGTPPAKGWPIVAWAHGTTGVADQCAPSRNELNPDIKDMIARFLQAGYMVVAPDYEGLGEPSGTELHPFLNLKSEAYSITDAVVAAKDYLGSEASNQWMAVGHSQGGQAALGAAQYAARASQMTYKGTVALAPASNFSLILAGGEAQAGQETNLNKKIETLASLDTFTALIVAGLRNPNPNLQYSQVFQNPTDDIAKNAESDCYEVLGGKFGNEMGIYLNDKKTLEGYPRTQANFMTIPVVKTFLEKDSQPLQVKVTTPVIIYQGGADKTVPKAATDVLVRSANQKQTSLGYITNNSWDHGSVYTSNIPNIIEDVKSLMPIQ
ncbi:lipase family protein [Acinetobacter schindleri]|uniref:Alpha/beta fold hydrolase n=1 Tax=Acinetobacter schindleri TaxID=108981 RepID=A0AAE6WVU6_9GAMM|nr:lipase family protein [Acinetobacter schindleri]QIC66824.1 alpha/beta fold hydrolase [Acinetobacter schindleri]